MGLKKRDAVEWAMHYRQIVILVVCVLMGFGVFSLSRMRKNEFPDFTIRQGLVIVACPGLTAEEIDEQVVKDLENYIFTYKEVKKEDTYSTSRDGFAFIQVELNSNLMNKDEFWSKFKHGIAEFKNELPGNVASVQVKDDFGDTSAMLITMESDDKTYRELNDYMDNLKDRLRRIKSVGRMRVEGMQKEQITVYLDNDKLSQYGISDQSLAGTLFSKGYTTTGGRVKNTKYVSPVYVERSLNTLRDVSELIVYADTKGNNIRLKDVARVVREYPDPDSYITNNGKKCLLLSVEMKKGKNIVQMGNEINEAMADFQQTLPPGVKIFRITDQSKVVDDSVVNFLHELAIAIVAVILVVMALLPLRVALVAASTIPVTIFISLGLFYAFNIELNTVTLAGLIVTLGMIVDNSIVIVDSYIEKLVKMSRWHASIQSTNQFFKSILSATMAISVTFFPLLLTTKGMVRDFLQSFPWAVTLILLISLLIAVLLVPFLQFYFIRKPIAGELPQNGKRKFSFLDALQNGYNKLLDRCFSFPYTTVALGVLSVIAGALLMGGLPQKLLPRAERNQFAVEIFMPTGTALKKTAEVADSLEHILRRDSRVVSVASFKGCVSPRFQNSYAPKIPGTNFAQFIVNTLDDAATVELLDEYTPRYAGYFPEAVVRFKELEYSEAVNPIEVRLSGDNLDRLKTEADNVAALLRLMPELELVRTDFREPLAGTKIVLDEDESTRLGISNALIESTMAMRYGDGEQVATAWEGDYDINIVVKSNRAEEAHGENLADEMIPVYGGLTSVPLRQVAEIKPYWNYGQVVRRNGVHTITVMAEVKRGLNELSVTDKIQEQIAGLSLADDLRVSYGGELEENEDMMPDIMAALMIAAVIIFFILLIHFHQINRALLIFMSMTLCLFGAASGILIQGVDFGVTCTLGLISLMGIIVRNGIIMIDYAEELRVAEKMSAREAIYYSARRRMRPIFLTSAAAAMGVVPMILSGSSLWMPMGTVIFYGTLITMVFLLTVLPVAYMLIFKKLTEERLAIEKMKKE